MAGNKIGKLACDTLCKELRSKEVKIEILNLEDNKLGDSNIINLIKALSVNNHLKILNLSKNYLTNVSAN